MYPSLRPTLTLCAALAAAALAPSAHATGRAEVSFKDPLQFADAGNGVAENERTRAALAAHLNRLAERLPDGQTLRVEVLDIDLAGELRFMKFDRVRVLGGGADWPQLNLRYELRTDSGVVAQGEERLSDMSYLMRLSDPRHAEPFAFERRMLDNWFGERFAAQLAMVR